MTNTLVKAFIKEFLPPGQRFRKGNNNHIIRIALALNSVLKSYYQVEHKLDHETIAKIFQDLDYDYFKNGEFVIINHKRIENVWVNISIKHLNLLRLVLKNQYENFGNDKKEEVDKLIERLTNFKL